MGYLTTSTLLILVWLSVSACQSSDIALPIHYEPPRTDLGGDYLAGELRMEDGCLRLYRIGWDEPGRTINQQLHDIWLPVWPKNFSLQHEGEEIQIVDNEGATVASIGDTVRLGGPSHWSGQTRKIELEETIPDACQGLYYLVGDEVSIVPQNEARIIPLPGSTLWFPRNNTRGGGPPHASMLAAPPKEQPLILEGDCLRIGKDGPVVIWPAGFYPDVQNGQVVVRNGGGVMVAAVGQEMKLDSGGYIPGNSGLCRGPQWGGTRFLEPLPNQGLGE